MKTTLFTIALFLTNFAHSSDYKASLSQLQHHFHTHENLKNHYLKSPTNNKKALLILPGMSEPASKYWELYDDIKDLGHDILIWDHLGQGQSDYISSTLDPQKIYVDDYDRYVSSLESFIKSIRKDYDSIDVIAHSMGGHILMLILYTNNNLVDKIVLSAPMVRMKLSIPSFIIRIVLSLFYSPEDWAPSQGPYRYRGLSESRVSQSQQRIDDYHQLLTDKPQLQRGGVTAGWILSSLDSTKRMSQLQDWGKIENSVLILQAENDHFVVNQPAKIICLQMKSCKAETFKESKHEIFMEKEAIRKKALNRTRAFLTEPNQS